MKYGKQEEEKEIEEVVEAEEDKALRFAKEIEKEAKGEEMEKEEAKEEESKKVNVVRMSEEKERQLAIMSRHKRLLYERMEKIANKKEKRVASLKKKANMTKGGLQKKENSV